MQDQLCNLGPGLQGTYFNCAESVCIFQAFSFQVLGLSAPPLVPPPQPQPIPEPQQPSSPPSIYSRAVRKLFHRGHLRCFFQVRTSISPRPCRYWRGHQTRRWGSSVYPGSAHSGDHPLQRQHLLHARTPQWQGLGPPSDAGTSLSPVLAPLHLLTGPQAPHLINGSSRSRGSALGPLTFTARADRKEFVSRIKPS